MKTNDINDWEIYQEIEKILLLEYNAWITDDVYHYTDIKNVPKILQNDTIQFRMTNFEDFEDKTEGKVVEVYYDLALEKLEKEKIISEKERFSLSNIDLTKEIIFRKVQTDEITVNLCEFADCKYYITCFSTKQDDDYMYKNYVRSEKGACIGFLGANLFFPNSYFNNSGAFVKGFKMLYGQEATQMIYEKLKNLFTHQSFKDFKTSELIISGIQQMLKTLKWRLKLGKYRKENEIRLVLAVPEKAYSNCEQVFIEKRENEKRYINFNVDKECFCTITVKGQTKDEYMDLCEEIKNKRYKILF